MTAAIGQSERRTDFQTPPLTVRDLVLLRIAAGGATRADFQRDVAPILAPQMSGTEFRRSAELAISTLCNTQLVSEAKGRLTASAKGRTGLGKGSGLPAKPGRLLAGQLFKQPREVASDDKLIVQLASEIAGARDQSFEALELAVLRRLTSPKTAPDPATIAPPRPKRSEPARHQSRTPTPKAANDRAPLTDFVPPATRTLSPDIAEFCSDVVDAARPYAEGWPGNRKAFISLVWKAIRNARPDWGYPRLRLRACSSKPIVRAGSCLRAPISKIRRKISRSPRSSTRTPSGTSCASKLEGMLI